VKEGKGEGSVRGGEGCGGGPESVKAKACDVVDQRTAGRPEGGAQDRRNVNGGLKGVYGSSEGEVGIEREWSDEKQGGYGRRKGGRW